MRISLHIAGCSYDLNQCYQQGVSNVQHDVPAGSAHRMFLINTKAVRPAGADGGRAQEFAVLGATGNGAQQKLKQQQQRWKQQQQHQKQPHGA
jgi:hypothetical protein